MGFMRWRPLTWLLLSLTFFLAALYFWRQGDEWALKKKSAPAPVASKQLRPQTSSAPAAPIPLLTSLSSLNLNPNLNLNRNTNPNPRTAFRLSNTPKTVGQLSRQENA